MESTIPLESNGRNAYMETNPKSPILVIGITKESIVPWHMSPIFECESEEDFVSK
jgi:hypothetical protein